jgi:hypothetical protein
MVMGLGTTAMVIRMLAAITHQPPLAPATPVKREMAALSASGHMIRRRAPISDMMDNAILAGESKFIWTMTGPP